MISAVNSSFKTFVTSQIDHTSKKEAKKFNELSTGKKDNAKDDPVALVKAEKLKSVVAAIDEGLKNVEQNSSTLDTASGSLSIIVDTLESLHAASIQASDSTLNAADRAVLSEVVSESLDTISQITQSTTSVSGSSLLDGSFANETVAVGDGADSITLNISSTTTDALGVSDIDVSSAESSAEAASQLEDALTSALSTLVSIGIQSDTLDTASQALSAKKEPLSFAKSGMEDADVAKLLTEMKALQIQKKAQVNTLAAANNNTQSTMEKLI